MSNGSKRFSCADRGRPIVMFLGHRPGVMVQKRATGVRFIPSAGCQGSYTGSPEQMWADWNGYSHPCCFGDQLAGRCIAHRLAVHGQPEGIDLSIASHQDRPIGAEIALDKKGSIPPARGARPVSFLSFPQP